MNCKDCDAVDSVTGGKETLCNYHQGYNKAISDVKEKLIKVDMRDGGKMITIYHIRKEIWNRLSNGDKKPIEINLNNVGIKK